MKPYQLTAEERHTYRRYAGLALPRHTSYPTPSAWKQDYGPAQFHEDLRRSAHLGRPLSLYVHVPFCERLCYYCACTKEIVPPARHVRQDPGRAFLNSLDREAERIAADLCAGDVHQVHLGGGSPTFLSPAQLETLWASLQGRFRIAEAAEIAVEIDPRVTTFVHLRTLRGLGFNRVSLGVQDFSPEIQRAINRVQAFELVEQCVSWCRSLGFASVNFDLIYGLPFQSIASMEDTLVKTIRLAPDRIAFYRLAVIPELFRWQKGFHPSDLPSGDLPLELNLLAINRFREAGYEFIGLDHFARPTEPLARAYQNGSLRRNFQGMTTGKDLDIVGLGPSGISQLEDAYAQNVKASADWQQAVAQDLGTAHGLRLKFDDQVRRELLQQLYGYGRIDKPALEERFSIRFDEYFAAEQFGLQELAGQEILVIDPQSIRLTIPLGRLLVRVVAAIFDRYVPAGAYRQGLAANQSSRVG